MDAGKSELVLAQGSSIHKVNISGANKRMLHLLKRAKVQLIKIDQQKQMKTAQVRTYLMLLSVPMSTSCNQTWWVSGLVGYLFALYI